MKETKVYKYAGGCSIQADIYDAGEGTPVIVYIHGGGLIFGTKEMLTLEQINLLTTSGFSIVNINYRLAPTTPFEQIIEDIRDALIWVKKEAASLYSFDTDNMAVMGGSAGGYLSLLTGTMEMKPKAIVSLYGYGNILGDWLEKSNDFYSQKELITKMKAEQAVGYKETANGDWQRYFYYVYCRQQGVWLEEVTKMNRQADYDKLVKYNSIDQVSKDYPPTLLLHGNKDTDVPYEQSVLMYNKLQEHGVESDLITMEGADHVFEKNFNLPDVQEAFARIVAFLNQHLKNVV